MRPHPFERVFAPRAIAVFGGGHPDSASGRVLRNVIAGGFAGAIYAIGARDAALPEVRCCASLAEAGGPVDLAIVADPAGALEEVVRACAAHGVAGAVILAGAVRADRAGEGGAGLASALAEAARRGMRVLGPNSVGVIRPDASLNATFGHGSASGGSLALVSQSGAICTTALDWAAARRIGFSAVVSLGDAADVDLGEVLQYLALDPETKRILLYVERVRSARSFLSGLRVAARAKPVVVVKSGRHSSSPATSDDAFDAALARAGAVRVPTVEQMFDAARLLTTRRAVAGSRLAILTNARAPGVLAADRAADLRVAIPPLAEPTRARLDAVLPAAGSRTNPVEVGWDADPARYRAALEACLADPNVDAVLAMLAPHALAMPTATAEAVVAAARGASKPVVACWMGEGLVQAARACLTEGEIPEFATPEAAVEAFAHLASHAHSQKLLRQVPGPLAPDALPRTDLAREVIRGALAQGRDRLTTTQVRKLLAAIGVRERDTAGRGVKGTELYLGVARDAVFGPVIRFGRGTSSGLAGEPVVALPPLDTAIIDTLMQASRISGLFTAGGGMAAAEVGRFERTLWAVSELVSELPELLELELCPLVATGSEVYASGVRVAIAPPAPGARRYDHMAIHPYPSGIGARWTLPHGAVVRVRPIRPEDAEMEASFVKNLSTSTKSFRFMVAMRELPRELLIRLTQIDYDRELALVALVERGGVEKEIAVARYAMTDAETAEIAIVVADEWQRRGVGLRLLEMIVDAARARGIARLEGEVLDENAAVIALVRRLGFTIRRDPSVGHIRVIEKVLTA